MSWYRDIHDWLGGYPYEFARADELFHFCNDKLGLRLKDLDMELMNCLLMEKE